MLFWNCFKNNERRPEVKRDDLYARGPRVLAALRNPNRNQQTEPESTNGTGISKLNQNQQTEPESANWTQKQLVSEIHFQVLFLRVRINRAETQTLLWALAGRPPGPPVVGRRGTRTRAWFQDVVLIPSCGIPGWRVSADMKLFHGASPRLRVSSHPRPRGPRRDIRVYYIISWSILRAVKRFMG